MVRKVTFLVQWLRSGGAEKQLLLYATELARRGYSVTVYCLSYADPHPRIEALIDIAKRAGVRIHRAATLFDQVGSLAFKTLRMLLDRSEGFLWVWGMRAELLAKALSGKGSKKMIISAQRSANRERLQGDKKLLNWRHERIKAYIANSACNIRLLSELVPGTAEKTSVIYNALSEEELAQEPIKVEATMDRLRVVMLGNIRMSIKGYDTALRAVAIARDRGIPVELHIGGRPDEIKLLKQAVTQNGLDDLVHYYGEIAEPFPFLRSGNTFLTTSRVEGLSNSLLEAMMIGLPCISTLVADTGVFPKEDEHVRCVPIDDPEAIVECWRSFLSNWKGASSMGLRARQMCLDTLSVKSVVDQIVVVLAGLEGLSRKTSAQL